MDFKGFFKKNYMHFIAVAVFLIIGFTYFAPQFSDYSIKQHDIEQYAGMASETKHHIEMNGEEPHWTNSMFGGMPTIQTTGYSEGNFLKRMTDFYSRNVPIPFGAFFLHALCFYFLALCLRIKPVIGILGALAFAFASYEIIILQAGHNTKAMAIGYMPAVLGAFIYTYRRDWRLGALLSAIFMGVQISANHLQVTYYMGFLLFALGVYFLIVAFKNKEFKQFLLGTGGLFVAYAIAISINYSSVATTSEYAEQTIRGANDLSVNPDGTEAKQGEGLDLSYITNWSWGKFETFTMVSPYVQGSHSALPDDPQFEGVIDKVELDGDESNYNNFLMYWGDQPSTSGPTYIGVVVLFLALLALIFVKSRMVWVLFGVSVLAVFLSWGKNMMWLTEFMVNNFPMYNKFRTVTINLVLVELCMPLLAMLSLQQLYTNREKIKGSRKTFLITSGAFLVFLIGLRIANGGDYMGERDRNTFEMTEDNIRGQIAQMTPEQAQEYGINLNDKAQIDKIVEQQMQPLYGGHDGIKKIRQELYNESTNRSIFLGIVAIGLCALFFYTSLPSIAIVISLAILVLIDLVPVDRNYLGEFEDPKSGEFMHWVEKEEKAYPVFATKADESILEMEMLGDEKLKSKIKEGEKHGQKVAEDLEYEGEYKRRVVDFYRFRALAAATNYRVADLRRDWGGAWGSSQASYLHKSIGGYHGAKLRRIQNLFDFQLRYGNESVMDMLNIKYELKENEAEVRTSTLGNAWAVKEVKVCKTPEEEMNALGTILKLKNVGDGKIFVNNVQTDNVEVTGRENLKYLLPSGDSLRILTSPNITSEVDVYFVADKKGNTNIVPEMTLSLDTLNSFEKLVDIDGVYKFNPAEQAVMLDSEAKDLSTTKYSGEATVKMTKFEPNYIKYDAQTKGKQLIVFSEVYYPKGWKALVDGKETDIHRVNYLLRGVEVDGGKHTIELVYVNEKAKTGKTLAIVSSILLILFVAGMGFLWYRSRSKNEVKEA